MSRDLAPTDRAHAEAVLGRALAPIEASVLAAMWSEHCSYRSSRALLTRLPRAGPHVVVGPGENAGAVDIGEGLVAVFKMESHNHPSYIEPYQGAATGVGGILRDIVAMGARPVAILDSIRFGRRETPRTRTLVRGVVAGIAGYGNAVGVPTVGGETRVHPSYDGNCLVNVLCVGVTRADALVRGAASGVGNLLLYAGARTGRDGIHGATMASAAFDADALQQSPTVQVGDPFQGKLLIEACMEAYATGAVVGAQDLGAAGLTSASVVLASRGGVGVRVDLDRVPRRHAHMRDLELLLSESQERFLLVVRRDAIAEVTRCFTRWGLLAEVIGEVTPDGMWRCVSAGVERLALPVELLARAPQEERVSRAPAPPRPVPAIVTHPDTASDVLFRIVAHPDVCDARWIWEQFDRHVGTDTVTGPEGVASRIRVKGHPRHLVIACAGNARHVVLDPRVGTAGQIFACVRRLACVGAEPLGVTDCLNFGDPGDPEVMGQLRASVEGLAEACEALGVPVVSGNVSLYNQTGDRPVLPTPTVGVVGVVDAAAPPVHARLPREGLVVAMLGEPAAHLGGSLYLDVAHGIGPVGARPPVHPALERALHEALRVLARRGLLEVAHPISDGGLAVALAELGLPVHPEAPCIGGTYVLDDVSPTALFGEDHARAVIAFDPDRREEVLLNVAGVPLRELGVARGGRLVVRGPTQVAIDVHMQELARAWTRVLPEWLE